MANETNESPASVASLAVTRGREQINVTDGGTITIDGPHGVNLYRLLMVKQGMELELRTHGRMKLTARANVWKIARDEHNLNGSNLRKGKQAIYVAFCEMHGFDVNPELLGA